MKKVLQIVIISLLAINLFAQIDTEFWFSAPDVSRQHYNNSIPLNLQITAESTTTVTIDRPADPSFLPIQYTLATGQTQEVRMDANPEFNNLSIDQIETYSIDHAATNFVQNKGFRITAYPGNISAYYDISGRNNTDLVSLKGRNALGKDFWVSTQRKYRNHGYTDDYSGFTVVATEDGTVIDIDPNGNNLAIHGTAPFSVTLNKGQSFAVRAAGQAASEHIFGVRVTSNEDIAIVIFDDSIQIDDGGGNWDIFSDQIVPVELLGNEYVIMKGEVQDDSGVTQDAEAVFITVTEDNTDIYVDGTLVAFLNTGDYYHYDITNDYTHIKATSPIYVNHITGYTTSKTGSRELGGALLPPVENCTGLYDVTIKRAPATGFSFLCNIIVRNDTNTVSPYKNQAVNNFYYSVNNGPVIKIDPSHFTYIMDSAFAVYDKTKAGDTVFYDDVSDGDVIRVQNPLSRFHLGVLHANRSSGGKYGYFSDFSFSDGSQGGYSVPNRITRCDLEPIQLYASGGVFYNWHPAYDTTLSDNISNSKIPNPTFTPDSAGIYYLEVGIQGLCDAGDTLQTLINILPTPEIDFSISERVGCSPFSPLISNKSDTVVGIIQEWKFSQEGEVPYMVDQSELSRSFHWDAPVNNSDSTKQHLIELTVKGAYHTCPVSMQDTVWVLPGSVKADFSFADSIGCQTSAIELKNLTTDTANVFSYQWYFGDGNQSGEFEPVKEFFNYTSQDTSYVLSLKLTGTNTCVDSISKIITVRPYTTQADYTMSASEICAEGRVELVNSTVNALYYTWVVDDTVMVADDTLKAPWNFEYTRNASQSIINRKIELHAFGIDSTCKSTQVRLLRIKPKLVVDFIANDTIYCKSTAADIVNLTNDESDLHSYTWTFGDGTNSTDKSPVKDYGNITGTLQEYTIELLVESDNYCADSMSRLIAVAPRMNITTELEVKSACEPAELLLFSRNASNVNKVDWQITAAEYIEEHSDLPNSQLSHIINEIDSPEKTFDVLSIAHGDFGCVDSVFFSPVSVYQQPTAIFEISPNPAMSEQLVNIENRSEKAVAFFWTLGDGTTSQEDSPIVSYEVSDTTVFELGLKAMNEHCADSSNKSLLVLPEQSTRLGSVPNAKGIVVYSKDDAIVINWEYKPQNAIVSIYNLSGQKLIQEKLLLGRGENILDNLQLGANVYLLRVVSDTQQFSGKILLK
jgi:hypothetical protein